MSTLFERLHDQFSRACAAIGDWASSPLSPEPSGMPSGWRDEPTFTDHLPSVNVDGTPMCGAVDIHGNPYGVTSSMDSHHQSPSFDSSPSFDGMSCGGIHDSWSGGSSCSGMDW